MKQQLYSSVADFYGEKRHMQLPTIF